MGTDNTLVEHRLTQDQQRLKRNAVWIGIIWSGLIVVFLTVAWWQTDRYTMALARSQAMVSFQNDVVYRRWNAMVGGVYAVVSPHVEPNPYLKVPHRDITSQDGVALTLINPAYMTRMVHVLKKQTELTQGHITSLQPIRPANAPAPWEAVALKTFESGAAEYIDIADVDGSPHMRFMRPLKVEYGCLKCHSHQGYAIGSIRGGISVTLPMSPFLEAQKSQMIIFIIGFLMIWGLGLLGLHYGYAQSRTRLTERLRELARNDHVRQLEAIGTLAGGVAHDFNNIISIILGNAELAEEDLGGDHPAVESVSEIKLASLRARDIVEQLIVYSRGSESELSPLDPSLILNEACKRMPSQMPAEIDCHCQIGDDLPQVKADPILIHQVLMALCANAADALAPNGGRIDLTAAAVQVSSADSRQLVGPPDGYYLSLSVHDDGSGIDPGHLPRVFDPYFTTKPVDQGSGMGLAIVHGIMKRHGGEVHIESDLGKGTTVTCWFPAALNRRASDRSPSSPVTDGGDERILFLDDETAITRLGRQILEPLGYRVDTFNDPISALNAIAADPNGFDLVVSDLVMPKRTGDRLVSDIHAINPDIPMVMVTGHSHRLTEIEASRLGIAAVLHKPLRKTDLAKVIREILDGKQPVA